jgi:hypothetical protein
MSTLQRRTPRARVFAEVRRFRSALPALLPIHEGKWVLFRDGQVQGLHATEDEAFVAAFDRFGTEADHIIAQVRELS